ncbi:uncharacterized protein PITG_01914 [Phytophthora infestans T30-4]|uniref:Uncharacterized protein n=1 Tax=Phytophthora infestans (strain T30-4) TaxID=403677 RepID=D0MUE4_PHYIT|nr:uncharacterized protein PITG_01914 [Phytophthora infestans T30-4]EEY61591.1 hypothetical protein PITG_01914 [Phytophthora infestans T30-4]|eukprot:XP_002908508.1 hypothetical protein PITG_01914 [Phytophthora infestans T30-4]
MFGTLRTSDAATLDDILSFVGVELWLSFYGVTPEAFYKPSNARCYPAAATVMTQTNSSAHRNSPFTINHIGFVSEVTIASLNDDLLRLRSQLVDGTGLAHLRNPKKG